MKLLYFTTIAISLSVLASCTKDIGPNPDLQPQPVGACDTVTFTKHIKPIIIANCAKSGCHEVGSLSGDFSTYPGLKGKVDNGTFNNRALVVRDMPQGGPPLSQEKIDLIKCWLAAGAPNN